MPPAKKTSPTKGGRVAAAAAAAARAPPLTAEGTSDSWESSKVNQLRIANKFLESVSDQALIDKWGFDWDKVPEEHACSPEIYQALAGYLSQEYHIEGTHKNSGQKLGPKTAIGVWSALINRSKDRFDSRTANPDMQVSRARFELLKPVIFILLLDIPKDLLSPASLVFRRSSTASRATNHLKPTGTRASRTR